MSDAEVPLATFSPPEQPQTQLPPQPAREPSYAPFNQAKLAQHVVPSAPLSCPSRCLCCHRRQFVTSGTSNGIREKLRLWLPAWGSVFQFFTNVGACGCSRSTAVGRTDGPRHDMPP